MCLNKYGWIKRFQLLEEDQAIIKDGYIYLTPDQTNLMKNEYSSHNNGELIPDLLETFIIKFNEFWETIIQDKEWLIKFMENFSKWLFLKGYTCGKISRIDTKDEQMKSPTAENFVAN